MPKDHQPHGFDAFAEGYDQALQRGLALSGEDKAFFLERRVASMRATAEAHIDEVRSIVDFGCGTGSAVPALLRAFPSASAVVGVDPSAASLDVARNDVTDTRVRFTDLSDWSNDGNADLVYTNGVFHHIPPADREASMQMIARSLVPGGLLSLWENNPYNPGTRLVMRRIPFDRDAVMVSPREAQNLVRDADLEVLSVAFYFFFPRALASLRRYEPLLAHVPLGAQFVVTARRR